MKTQIKTSIVLLSIFALGIILGVVIDRTLVEHQMKSRFSRMRNPRMFGHFLERIIKPTPEQNQKIRQLLQNYSQKMDETRWHVMKESIAIMDSLRHDLEPILTEEQKKRLEEHRKRIEMRRGDFPGLKRPPFDEPPPEPF